MTQLSDPGQNGATQVSDLSQKRERPKYPLSKAAEMAGVSVSTIKRKRAAGAFPHAVQDVHGTWLIPVEDLLAAGYHLNGVTHLSRSATQVSDPGQAVVTQLSDPGQAQLDELRHRLEVSEVRRAAAEHLAAEKDKRIADLTVVLDVLRHQLTAAPTPPPPAAADTSNPGPGQPPPAESVHTSGTSEPTPKRRFWRR